MTKPDKPIEAQGLGCGLIISVVGMTAFLAWLGVPPGPAMIIAMVLAGLSLIAFMVNQFKAQRILDATFEEVTERKAVHSAETLAPPPIGGNGRYCVIGVDRASGMDTTWYTAAASAANAKVKGELQGIVVTQVTRA